jgi:ribosomal protein S18 acetylase RimI-like enzyme
LRLSIKKVTEKDNFQSLAKLLNDSFITVTDSFGITKDNCPSNNAFIDSNTLKSKLISNREFYKYENSGYPIGFIAIEKSEKEIDTFYIEKVAVHPEHRHKGLGKQLMDFATKRIIELGGKRISIGLIDSNTELKKWYQNQGYIQTGTKLFDHLPFNVCLMDKTLNDKTI